MTKALRIHPGDNVAVLLQDAQAGERLTVNGRDIIVSKDTKAKHKIALCIIHKDALIRMYGVIVGQALVAIEKGAALTTSNISHRTNAISTKAVFPKWRPEGLGSVRERSFLGYHRADGQVGTKNIWLFFPLVFCENRNIERLREAFEKEFSPRGLSRERRVLRSLMYGDENKRVETESGNCHRPFPNVEVRFLTHDGGCGGTREDAIMLARLLAGYMNNPNVAGVSVLSLGCQNLQLAQFKALVAERYPNLGKPVLYFEQQQMGTITEMLDQIIRRSFEGIKKANESVRRPAPLSKLTVGWSAAVLTVFPEYRRIPFLVWSRTFWYKWGVRPFYPSSRNSVG